MQPQAFSSADYKIEPIVEFKTEKGILTQKTCPVTNFIRHKFVESSEIDKEAVSLESLIGLVSTGEPKQKVSLISASVNCERWLATLSWLNGVMAQCS